MGRPVLSPRIPDGDHVCVEPDEAGGWHVVRRAQIDRRTFRMPGPIIEELARGRTEEEAERAWRRAQMEGAKP